MIENLTREESEVLDYSPRGNGRRNGVLPDSNGLDHDQINNGKDLDSLLDGLQPIRPKIVSELIYKENEADPVALYIQEIAQYDLLTKNQEVELSQQREKGVISKDTLAAVEVIDPRVQNLLESLVVQGEAARETLYESNLRLVVSVARKHINRGLPFLDLIQEGNIGLGRGIDKFDWRRGFKLSTYATWWIRQKITRAISDHGHTIHIPAHITDKISQVGRATIHLRQELGREPTLVEIGESLDMTADKVRNIFIYGMDTLSLETPVGEEETATLEGMIADENEDPEKEGDQELLGQDLDQFMKKYLTSRERKVLRLRYGLDGKENILDDIGNELSITRERTRQIEAKALQKLRGNPAVLADLRDWFH